MLRKDKCGPSSLLHQSIFSFLWSGGYVACTQIPLEGLAVFSVNIYFLPFLPSLECHQHADFVIKEFFDF